MLQSHVLELAVRQVLSGTSSDQDVLVSHRRKVSGAAGEEGQYVFWQLLALPGPHCHPKLGARTDAAGTDGVYETTVLSVSPLAPAIILTVNE